MKKTILAASLIAAMTMSLGSCGHGEGQVETDTTLSQQDIDSMSVSYGNFMGAYFDQMIRSSVELDTINVNKEDFLRGLQMVLSDDRSEDFAAGVNAGLQIRADLEQIKKQGVTLDRATIVSLIRKHLMRDSVGSKELELYQKQFGEYQKKFEDKVVRREELRALNSPQGIANNNAGKAYARDYQKNTPGVQKSESGLVYLIENEGTKPLDKTQPIIANVTVKHVNGRVIDSARGISMMSDGLLPGVKEALSLLSAGSKGIFVLPPELAYGTHGSPNNGIGPMEWVIYEIEAIDNISPDKIPHTTEMPQ